MPGPVSIVLSGLGGYGLCYLEGLLDQPDDGRFRLVAGVDPAPQNCKRLADLEARRVPVYQSLEESTVWQADLQCWSLAIHQHCRRRAWRWRTAATCCARSRPRPRFRTWTA